MPKIYAEIKNPKTGLWGNVTAFAIPLSGLVAVALITYTIIHDNFEDTIMSQQTVIDNLETRLNQLSLEYADLLEKTKGVNELQLWKSDAIEVAKENLTLDGGAISFFVKAYDETFWQSRKLDKEALVVIYTNRPENIRDEYRYINLWEYYPFKSGESKYLLRFTSFTADHRYIMAEIYIVKPLYIQPEPLDQ